MTLERPQIALMLKNRFTHELLGFYAHYQIPVALTYAIMTPSGWREMPLLN